MLSPTAPSLPSEIELSGPYVLDVPRNPALTIESLKIKTTLWPTIYTPRKKGELESITTGQARWAWQAMRVVVQEAKASEAKGEVCALTSSIGLLFMYSLVTHRCLRSDPI